MPNYLRHECVPLCAIDEHILTPVVSTFNWFLYNVSGIDSGLSSYTALIFIIFVIILAMPVLLVVFFYFTVISLFLSRYKLKAEGISLTSFFISCLKNKKSLRGLKWVTGVHEGWNESEEFMGRWRVKEESMRWWNESKGSPWGNELLYFFLIFFIILAMPILLAAFFTSQ